MIWRVLLIAVAMLLFGAGGCKKQPPAEPTQVKITGENLDTELDKLETQIEADIAAEE